MKYHKFILLTILCLFFSSAVTFAEEESVLLRWKIPKGEYLGYKTSMNKISDERKPVPFGDFKDINPPIPANYFYITVIQPVENGNYLVEMLLDEYRFESEGSSKDSNKIKDMHKSLLGKFIGKVQLRSDIKPSGKCDTFYLAQGQRNLVSMFFQLPEKRVKVGDTWPIDIQWITMGNGFICQKCEHINEVKLTAFEPAPNGDQLAVIDYNIKEMVEGRMLKADFKMEFSYKGTGKFLVNAGKWKEFKGTMTSSTTTPSKGRVVQSMILEPMANVPDYARNLLERDRKEAFK